MAKVTLAEQMGAMALIDELRHRQMLVQEHLNLAERRREVARRIRDYYASRHIEVDDALVEQGVREYFSRRLAFEAPRLGIATSFLARLYIGRRQALKSLILATALLAAGVVGLHKWQASQDAAWTARVQAAVDDGRARAGEVRQTFLRVSSGAEAMAKRLPTARLPAASRLLDQVHEQLAQAGAVIARPFPALVTAQSRDKDQASLAGQMADLDQTARTLSECDARLRTIATLVGTYHDLEGLVRERNFEEAWNRYPAFQEAEGRAREALEVADSQGVAAATVAVHHLRVMYDDIGRLQRLAINQERVMAEFKRMGLRPEEEEQVESLAAAFTAARQAIDGVGAQKLLGQLSDLLAYARTPLTLAIADKPGRPFAIERGNPADGDKVWYLVLEARDAQGHSVAIPWLPEGKVGSGTVATSLGLRVSQAEYEKFKAMKEGRGHIDDPVLGQKPSNSLSFSFKNATATKPEILFDL